MSDDTLVAALARAQAEFPVIQKTHTNPHFKSRYADLSDVIGAVRPVLAKHGIALVQPIRVTEHGAELVTALLKGDERIESSLPLPLDSKPQDMGSRLTYLRRFQLAALVGVAAEDDDDGNAANAAPVAKKKPALRVTESTTPRNVDAPTPDGEALTFDQLVAINEHWSTYGDPDVRKARKREFAARFGDPKTATVDQWPAIEAFMQEAPF